MKTHVNACCRRCWTVSVFPSVFGIALFGVLMLIGRLPIQPAFVCHDCCFHTRRPRSSENFQNSVPRTYTCWGTRNHRRINRQRNRERGWVYSISAGNTTSRGSSGTMVNHTDTDDSREVMRCLRISRFCLVIDNFVIIKPLSTKRSADQHFVLISSYLE